MRIDSSSFFSAGLNGIRDNQVSMARLNRQITTGQALLAPKDDPVAMSRIMNLTDSIALRNQYAANQVKANIAIDFESTVLNGVEKNIRSIRGLVAGISAGNDSATRSITAQQLESLFNQLKDLANSKDSAGNYIFAGSRTNLPSTTPPFVNDGGGSVPATVPITGLATTYNGDALVRSVEIDIGRTAQVSDNLNTVFQAGVVGSDLLQTIDEAIQRLPADATLTSADLARYLGVIDEALGNLDSIQFRLASAQSAVKDAQTSTQAFLLSDKNALGELSQVDKTEAIVELQSRQTSLEAASNAFAMVSGLSLFKYL
jgi:flagellar hook-associated protein 3 FlgL